ncbi:MAG: hypothetical protein FIB08_07815 [Candidatus Methanoperedens sp.]|nr:hypothetical protein [Candidatus Methanoperedens sp.]
MNEEKSVKAAIVYLARSRPGDIAELKRSLSLLDVNFNDKFNYPVVIFHEDINEKLMGKIRESTRSQIQFEKVSFKIPDFLNKEEVPELIYLDGDCFSMGYRHMCRFFSGIIFHHPALKDYDYYWRLDTDSFLLDKIDYDVFQFMHERNFKYGYIGIFKDEPGVTRDLWDTTKKYIEDNNLKPQFLQKFMSDGIWDRSYYYTNFEISRLDFWRSEEFMNYFEYLDRAGGIYKYRWGDAVIHLLAVSIFLPESNVHRFSDIAYQHQGFFNNYSPSPDIFSRLKNLKEIIKKPVVRTSNSLKRKSGLYRRFIKFVKRES